MPALHDNKTPLTRPIPALAAALLLPLIAGAPVQAAGTVAPNETLVLRSGQVPNLPDGTMQDCQRFPLGLLAVCQYDQVGDRVGARTATTRAFRRTTATISSYYDFKVDDAGGEFDTVVNAQIAGSGEFNGFLALVAGGSVVGSLTMTMYDLGPAATAGTAAGDVVFRETLADHQLQGTITTGVDFSIHVEGGAPYVGFGGSPGLKFNVKIQKQIVRDSISFGLQALVRRGHKYRIVFDVVSKSKRGATAGASISQFLVSEVAEDILDTENWLPGVVDTLTASLPNLRAESMRIKEGQGPLADLLWPNNQRMVEPEIVASDGSSTVIGGTNQLLIQRAAPAGLPTSFTDIVVERFRQSLPDIEDELIETPGFFLDQLTVTLATDPVEIAAEQTDRLNEVIRLLLTPQGQRDSEFIDCDGPGNSDSNGNTNGNGNGLGNSDGCSFPGAPGNSADSGNGGNNSADAAGNSGSGSVLAASSAAGPMAANSRGGGGAAGWAALAGLAVMAFAVGGLGGRTG